MRQTKAADAITFALASTAIAQESPDQKRIDRALSAAPALVTANATVMEWEGKQVLRQGSNSYMCFPEAPVSTAPFCVEEMFLNFIEAVLKRENPPAIDRITIGYWLQGGGEGRSAEDPFATVEEMAHHVKADGMPHLGILVPDQRILEALPTDPAQGGPWVMWKHTPYVHIMVPAPRQQ